MPDHFRARRLNRTRRMDPVNDPYAVPYKEPPLIDALEADLRAKNLLPASRVPADASVISACFICHEMLVYNTETQSVHCGGGHLWINGAAFIKARQAKAHFYLRAGIFFAAATLVSVMAALFTYFTGQSSSSGFWGFLTVAWACGGAISFSKVEDLS